MKHCIEYSDKSLYSSYTSLQADKDILVEENQV